MPDVISIEVIASKILIMRGKRVMLDNDLAGLYGVDTKNLNKAVKRNIERFPEDFMFQLTKKEVDSLRFQIGTSNSRSQIVTLKQGQNIKYLPYATIKDIFEAVRQLLEPPPEKEKKIIGFKVGK